MLVISRRSGEAFTIGADVEVIVLRASTGRVTIGIRAPKAAAIRRTRPGEPDRAPPAVAIVARRRGAAA